MIVTLVQSPGIGYIAQLVVAWSVGTLRVLFYELDSSTTFCAACDEHKYLICVWVLLCIYKYKSTL